MVLQNSRFCGTSLGGSAGTKSMYSESNVALRVWLDRLEPELQSPSNWYHEILNVYVHS